MNLEFGYSPCPNDTFMFWAWAHRRLASEIELWPHLADIQELNRLALDSGGHLPLTKVSASTYLQPQVRERYRLLNVGGALGRGCGPLIVTRKTWGEGQPPSGLRLAVPGLDTTACRLARTALAKGVGEWVELRYDEIMPAVLDGRVDAGVIIHESRFTYRGLGLHLACDLGVWWEERTGLPLPLGVMLASRNLSEARVEQVENALRTSIEKAWSVFRAPADPESQALWRYLREHAIELDDTTIASHIELYVNDFSLQLGAEGHAALARFEDMTRAQVR
jgi:1,4-dihydroxy-6-naphthoate synthase